MEKQIFVKRVENAFANEETGVEVTLFRHKILLTIEEAYELFNRLQIDLWGLQIPIKN